jgi:ATP-dependent RNA helicase RhlB
MTFKELELDEDLQRGIDDAGFTECTEVQEKTFEHSLHRRDVTVQSQTGTGKTAAFLITIFQLFRRDPNYRGGRALVVAPTRELAVQIEHDAKMLGKHLDFRVTCIYGGVGYKPQEDALAAGVDIVVGTPGRLLDLNQSKKLDFGMFNIAVIDEADRLFDMGFYPDIQKIFRRLPPKEQRITMLYSATLGTRVLNISWQYMNDPVEIKITPERMTVEEVDQQVFHVSKNEKMSLLLGLLREEQPETSLIFANTKAMCEELAYRLRENGYKAQYMMGDLPQKKRLQIIDDLKKGKTDLLVATDVAARGLHVDDLDLVINYDLPEDPESYVHRIGRTARAGKKGRAISLACERFVYSLEPIQEFIGMKIPPVHPGDSDFGEDATRGRSLAQLRRAHSGSATSRSGRKRRSGGSDEGRHKPRHGGGGRASDAREKTRHSEGDRVGAGSGESGRSSGGGSGGRSGARHGKSSRTNQGHGGRSSGGGGASGRRGPSGRGHAGTESSGTKPSGGGPSGGQGKQESRPSKRSSPEDRLQYYREKYGEDFAFAEGGGSSSVGSSSAGSSRAEKSGPAEKPGARKEAAAEKRSASQETAAARKQSAPETRDESRGESEEKRSGIMKRLRRVLGRSSG